MDYATVLLVNWRSNRLHLQYFQLVTLLAIISSKQICIYYSLSISPRGDPRDFSQSVKILPHVGGNNICITCYIFEFSPIRSPKNYQWLKESLDMNAGQWTTNPLLYSFNHTTFVHSFASKRDQYRLLFFPKESPLVFPNLSNQTKTMTFKIT